MSNSNELCALVVLHSDNYTRIDKFFFSQKILECLRRSTSILRTEKLMCALLWSVYKILMSCMSGAQFITSRNI